MLNMGTWSMLSNVAYSPRGSFFHSGIKFFQAWNQAVKRI